ncbi:hypothetical protein ACHAWC_008883 [Mediolabrus comicus]
MKNIIKSKFLDATQRRLRNTSLSSNEGEGGGSEQQQQSHRQKRPSKKYFRQQEPQQQQLLQQQHRQRSPSHLREESRSDSKSPHYRHQHQHQQQQRDSGVRDLFQFQNSSSQQHQQAPPQMPIQQPRDQAVFRNTGYYSAPQQLQSSYVRDQQHFYSSHPQQQQQQKHYQQHYHHHQQQHQHHSRSSPRVVRNESSSKRRQYSNPFLSSQQEHEHQQQQHYQHDYADKFGSNRGLSQSASPLSLSGVSSTLSPVERNHFRPRQHHQHEQQQAQFDFGSKNNLTTPNEDNCRVRFLSSSSSVSSSFSEEPSQVHMMAGGGQSVASSSCMSAENSYLLLDSGNKRNSKSDLAIFDKVMRGVMNEENERLCAMGMASINLDGTTAAPDSSTAGRTSPDHQWETPTVLPRMNSQNNEEFELEVGIESEYHDFGDDEVIHHQYASPLSASPLKRGIAATVAAPTNKVASSGSRSPTNNSAGRRNQKSEKQDDFGMATFSQWSSSYFG